MRITRFIDHAGQTRHGLDRGDQTAELLARSPLHTAPDLPEPTGETATIARRLAPVEPVNIFCIGLNYRAHARETGAQLPDHPVVFMKPTSALNHPEQPIRIPASTRGDEVDYECELAVIIGKPGRDIHENHALEHVLGYTCANDVSARKWQKHGGGGQWVRGKSFDTFCPLGPVLVTADQLPDPHNLALSTTLNDRIMQQSRTSDMIFSVPQIIAFLSRDTTLLTGTVILTGTPPGVGVARNPPVFCRPGDRLACEIQHIGQLRNPVVQ